MPAVMDTIALVIEIAAPITDTIASVLESVALVIDTILSVSGERASNN